MKSALNWILKNAWNLFSVIGVIGTFYFSLAYVPDYVKEISTSKVNIINEGLVSEVQELLFYDKPVSIDEINSFIKGKELKQGVSYPYTPDELLAQVQEEFMSNKFIPLDKRESIIQTIQEIRSKYDHPKKPEKKPLDWKDFLSWLLSGAGMAIAVTGATSIARKLKIDKETEVDIVSGSLIVNQQHVHIQARAFEYEKMVGEALSELGVLKRPEGAELDVGYDFLAGSNGNEVIVEAKSFTKLLGLGTAREFMSRVIESGKGGVLVVSSGVTQRTKELISEHNKINDSQKVFLVVGDSKESVKSQLAKIFEV